MQDRRSARYLGTRANASQSRSRDWRAYRSSAEPDSFLPASISPPRATYRLGNTRGNLAAPDRTENETTSGLGSIRELRRGRSTAVGLLPAASKEEVRRAPADDSRAQGLGRKLPSLPDSLRSNLPVDNPALHQGRIRTSPHVEGQYAAYVYVPLILERDSPLRKLLMKAFLFAKASVPPLHPIGLPEELNSPESGTHAENPDVALSPDSVELHVSLTRPVYLRAHQREDLKRAVKAIALSHSP